MAIDKLLSKPIEADLVPDVVDAGQAPLAKVVTGVIGVDAHVTGVEELEVNQVVGHPGFPQRGAEGLSPQVEMDDHKMYYDKRDLWPVLVKAGFSPSRIALRYHKFGLNLFAVARMAGSRPTNSAMSSAPFQVRESVGGR